MPQGKQWAKKARISNRKPNDTRISYTVGKADAR